MIVNRIFALYENDPKRKPSTGNPTGSRFGTCTAQLQLLRHPALGKPALPQPRAMMTWDEGDRTEEWLAQKLVEAYPGVVGLRQEVFYFAVPLPDNAALEHLRTAILLDAKDPRSLWGRILPGFVRPFLRRGDDGRRKMRLLHCQRCVDQGRDHARQRDALGRREPCAKNLGFILDPAARVLYAPTYVDFIIDEPSLDLSIIEA